MDCKPIADSVSVPKKNRKFKAMSPTQVSYPGVYIEEIPSGVKTIGGVSTSIAAFIGLSAYEVVEEEGDKKGEPVKIFSYPEYVRKFGPVNPDSDLATSVKMFFGNGGGECWVVNIHDSATKAYTDIGPQNPIVFSAVKDGAEYNDIEIVLGDLDTSGARATFSITVSNIPEALLPGTPVIGPFAGLDLTTIEATLNGDVDFLQILKCEVPDGSEDVLPLESPVTLDDGAGVKATAALAVKGPLLTLESRNDIPDGENIIVTVGDTDEHGNFEVTFVGAAGAPPPIPCTMADVVVEIEGAVSVDCTLSSWSPHSTIPPGTYTFRDDTTGDLPSDEAILEIYDDYESLKFEAKEYSSIYNEIEVVVSELDESKDPPEFKITMDLIPGIPGPVSYAGTVSGIITDITTDPVVSVVLDVGTDPGVGNDAYPEEGEYGFEKGVNGATATASIESAIKDMHIEAKIPGASGNDISVEILPTGSTFTVVVKQNGREVSEYNDCIIDSSDDATNHVCTLINNDPTSIITCETLPAADGRIPAEGESSLVDGTDNELPLDPQAKYEAAIESLKKVDAFNILILTKLRPVDYDFDIVYEELLLLAATTCKEKRAFLLVDPREEWETWDAPLDDIATIRGKVKYVDHAAIYFPRLRLKENGKPIEIGPAAAIAGIMAEVDSRRGIWKAPAGVNTLIGGIDNLEVLLTDKENGKLNPQAINCIRTFPAGTVCWGARTMAGNAEGDWKYIPIRRLALYIEEALYRGTQWVVFEPNDEPVWSAVRATVNAFMLNLFNQGAFQGGSPKESFFVKCDKDTTTEYHRNLGIMNIVIGFAPLKPAEFVVIQIQQIAQTS